MSAANDRQAQPEHISRELLEQGRISEAAFNAVLKRAAAWHQPVAVVGLQPVAALQTGTTRCVARY